MYSKTCDDLLLRAEKTLLRFRKYQKGGLSQETAGKRNISSQGCICKEERKQERIPKKYNRTAWLGRQAGSRQEHVTKVELNGLNQLIGQKERRMDKSIYFNMRKFDENRHTRCVVKQLGKGASKVH
jgi:hypothetical protein